jgi:hypothetical protein
MPKKALLITAIFSLFLFSALPALAHQPRFVREATSIEVVNPEISQAFYGELAGGPAFYEVRADKSFNLYLGLLVPDIIGIKKDLSATMIRRTETGEEEVLNLDGQNYKWARFFEEFAGDHYWQGPEGRDEEAEPGTYIIKVSRPGNLGKYVLAIGETESFPPGEMVKIFWTLPALKKDFFNKSPWSAFNNKIGEYLGGFILVLAVLVVVLVIIIKKIRRKIAKIRH